MNYFCIVKVIDITDDMIQESVNTQDSIRLSIDSQYGLLKFNLRFPISMKGYKKYTKSEIRPILASLDWSVPHAEI